MYGKDVRTCRVCGEGCFRLTIGMEQGIWWHEDERLDSQHKATPAARPAIVLGADPRARDIIWRAPAGPSSRRWEHYTANNSGGSGRQHGK